MGNLRKRKKDKKEKKQLPITLIAIILGFIGIGFAAVIRTFGFYGNANVAAAGFFEIQFENLEVNSGSAATTTPATIDQTDPTIINFGVKLEEETDFYEFEVDIANTGTIPGKVSEVLLSTTPIDFAKYLSYTVMYNDNTEIKVDDILAPNTSKRIKVNIKYAEGVDLSELTNEEETLKLSFEVKYVENRPEKPNPVIPSSGDNLIQVLGLDKGVSNDSTVAFGSPSSSTNGQGLLVRTGTESYEHPIYYYRGNVTNNNVLFADYCWKIVRTTESGGTKLVYNGVPNGGKCNSTDVSIGQSEFNSTKSDAKYVGYMFSSSQDISSSDEAVNTTDSAIKEIIDNWYKDNLTAYDRYLEDAIWCNDRATESSGTTISFAPIEVRGLDSTSPTPQIIDSKVCTRKIDRFTKSSSIGNGKLQYSIGLLTADEVLVAGNGIDGGNTYLTEANAFWTMTPSLFASRSANIFGVYEDGALDGVNVNDDAMDVRPSIVLKGGNNVSSGDGTANSPYVIAEMSESSGKKPSIIQSLGLDASAKDDTSINFATLKENGLYKWHSSTEESPVYYYRGNVTNNNIIFAEKCWKIVRTTESGGTKLVYNGDPVGGKCTSTNVSIGQNTFNDAKNPAKYVGYMYSDTLDIDSDDPTVNTIDSAIKETIDSWYMSNIVAYDQYLEDAVWCNDRATNSSGTTISFAASEERGLDTDTPQPEILDSKVCSRKIDKFTKSSSIGNGKLQYSVGLLTADEVLVAGNGIDGGNTYLTEANAFWTMTPSLFASRSANIFGVYEDGALDGVNVNDDAMDVRPAVVLKAGVKVGSGDGTANNPYVVSELGDDDVSSEPSILESLGLAASAKDDTSVNFATLSENGLYKWHSSAEASPIYYYRGNVANNNVLFAEKCWKIVRTTESGGTKLVYNGLPSGGQCTATGVATQIDTGVFNSTKNPARYVGYMFNSTLDVSDTTAEANATNSDIRDTLDQWYSNNMTSYTGFLEDAIWCNDRATESSGSTISFAAIETRGLDDSTPKPEIMDSKVCSRSIDKFTMGYSTGNGKLQYPVGLLTADEAVVAGNGINGGATYLTSGSPFWTMTPSLFASRSSNMFAVYEDGMLDGATVDDDSLGIRPSVVLKSGLKVSGGDGTKSNPYTIG